MKFLKETTWSDVFESWRKREASNPSWVECATKIKGWPDWESWRSFTAEQFDAPNRDWKIFQFTNPEEEIPEMLLGPYSGWQSKVIRRHETTFKELLEIPAQYEELSKHSGIQAITKGLPFTTEFIGVVRKDNGKIVCVEGHHCATAIALARMNGKMIDFSKTSITIALAELPVDDCNLFESILQRGTLKNP
jgi:hypothetical protein